MLILIAVFLVQIAIYSLLIWFLARLLMTYDPLTRWSIFLACLLVGLGSGLLTAWFWPRFDSVLYPNMAAFIVGEEVYRLVTSTVPAGTASPHRATAWPLRIPQLFVFTSILLLATAGLVMQLYYNHKHPAGSNISDH